MTQSFHIKLGNIDTSVSYYCKMFTAMIGGLTDVTNFNQMDIKYFIETGKNGATRYNCRLED